MPTYEWVVEQHDRDGEIIATHQFESAGDAIEFASTTRLKPPVYVALVRDEDGARSWAYLPLDGQSPLPRWFHDREGDSTRVPVPQQFRTEVALMRQEFDHVDI
jgi:hypothetical protein